MKLEAKDLRIGNIIQDIKYKSPWRIECFLGKTMATVDAALVNFETDDLHDIDLDEHEPIELTEEWLLKFGYTKIFDDLDKINRYGIVKEGVFRYGLIVSKKGLCYPTNEGGVFLKYVHQLQNLYFALTGEELTTKQKQK